MFKRIVSATNFYIAIISVTLVFLVLQIYFLHKSRLEFYDLLTYSTCELHEGRMPEGVMGIGILENGKLKSRRGILPELTPDLKKDGVTQLSTGYVLRFGNKIVYFSNNPRWDRLQTVYRLQIGVSIIFCLVIMWFGLLFYYVVYRSVKKLEGWVRDRSAIKKAERPLQKNDIQIDGFTRIVSGIEKLYSDLVNTEKEIERKTKLEALGVLFAKVLHDIKNGLASIRIYQYLLRSASEESRRNELTTKIEENMNDITVMIQDVLDFVRGSKTSLKERVRIKDLYNGLKTEYSAKAEVDHVQFEISLDPDIAERTIHVDMVRIVTALKHLINNAFEEVSLAGKSTSEVRIGLSSQDNDLLVEITDNGRGIPEKVQGKMFMPFVSEGKATGNGIGTSVSREYIEAQNGHVEFSTSSEGTTFRVLVPFSAQR